MVDGKQLIYLDQMTNHLVAVDVRTVPTFAFGKPTPVPIERIDTSGARNYDISPDGKHFVIVTFASTNLADQSKRANTQINVVVNWFEELKRLAPTK